VVLLGTFPGLTTAVLTNVFLSLFEKSIVYYSILNILFAWLGYVFIKRGWLQRVRGIIGYIVTSGLLTGVLGGTIQLVIKSLRPYKETVQLAEFISKALSIDYIPSFFLSNISFSLLDRALVTLIAFAIIRMIPDRI
jgi:hypothetical protein